MTLVAIVVVVQCIGGQERSQKGAVEVVIKYEGMNSKNSMSQVFTVHSMFKGVSSNF